MHEKRIGIAYEGGSDLRVKGVLIFLCEGSFDSCVKEVLYVKDILYVKEVLICWKKFYV